MRKVFHALTLNLHQPPGNLQWLLDNNGWEAKEILWALDRMPRALWGYEDVARVHLAMSGTLLETLIDPAFQERVFGIIKCGDLLWHLQNRNLFEIPPDEIGDTQVLETVFEGRVVYAREAR